MKKLLLIIVIILFGSIKGFSQGKGNSAVIFKAFENAFNYSNPALLSTYLADETYLSVKSEYSGYYSKSQAFYILQDFISSYAPFKIKFTHKRLDSSSPFAEGVLFFSLRGRRQRAKVFVSLEEQKGNFVIAQITID